MSTRLGLTTDIVASSRSGRGQQVAWALAVALALVLYLGLISNAQAVNSLWSGQQVVNEGSYASVWQYIREALTALIALALGIRRLRETRRRPTVLLVGVLAFLGWQSARVLIDPNTPNLDVVLGLRFLDLVLLIYGLAGLNVRSRVLLIRRVALLSLPFLATQLVIAGLQIAIGPGTLGRTFLGARPWGTYSSSDNLGMFAVAEAILIAVSDLKHRGWLLAVCGGLSIATGSRNAILGMLVMFAAILVTRIPYRVFLAPAAIGLGAVVFSVASSQAVSGRDIQGEGRFVAWAQAIAQLNDPFTILFGEGLGTGSNAKTIIYGANSIQGTAITDSALVMIMISLGLFGIAMYVIGLVVAWRRLDPHYRAVIILPLVLCAVVFNFPEVSPINAVAAIVIGCMWVTPTVGDQLDVGVRHSSSPL